MEGEVIKSFYLKSGQEDFKIETGKRYVANFPSKPQRQQSGTLQVSNHQLQILHLGTVHLGWTVRSSSGKPGESESFFVVIS